MPGLVFLVLCLLCSGDVAVSHDELKNVAYGKYAFQSSECGVPGYSGSKAVNGLFTDLAHSGAEKTPFLVIDLGKNYVIQEIEVFARKRWERIAMWCTVDTVGRYVKIQITSGVSNVLTPAEVLVWGHL
ncbi:uncharacterized protein LOC134232169 [Saccostrea cucullata]|uniref:uncharacterized protein LOC134232169 n=1 Tax=Saccostrea cuccullata TaxID=36930 RepID=UPI002ED2311B